MSTGRNDPCPCGSGRKFKKCHGALAADVRASPEVARATALKARDVVLGERLMTFARAQYGPRWLQESLDAVGSLADVDLSEAEMPFVVPWLLYFQPDPDGLTLAREWMSRELPRIAGDDALLLDAYDAAWVSIWEVAEVEAGVGSRLTDVLTREQRFVHDVRSSSTLRRFDTVLAIVVTCGDVSFFGGVHAQPLPPRSADLVAREARRICRVRTRPVPLKKLRAPEMQLELLALWCVVVDEMLDQPPPFMQNTDGDPFVLTKDDFSLLASSRQIAQRLASFPGVQPPETEGADTVFVVTKAGNAVHKSWDNTVIGRLLVSDTRMTLETNSTRRADALRSAVEGHLRGLVRFRLRKEENTTQLVAEARAAGGARTERAEEPLPPEAVAALRQFRERHLRDWLDTAIPALEGFTPREAARLPRSRPKLELLLKEFEQIEARQPARQRLDLRWLRDALGFS